MGGELYLGLAGISIILIRWYFITLSMYSRMLEFSDNEFKYKDSVIFKLLVRLYAIPMAFIAPIRAMVFLSEFDVLWDGVSDDQLKAMMAVNKTEVTECEDCGKESCDGCVA